MENTTTYFCCPDCGKMFYITLFTFSNTIHECPANPGVLTYVPMPWDNEKQNDKPEVKHAK